MKKNIWLFGIISVVAIFGVVFLYNRFIYPETELYKEDLARKEAAALEETRIMEEFSWEDKRIDEKNPAGWSYSHEAGPRHSYFLENRLFKAEFSREGGEMVSLQLKEHRNEDGSPVEMIFSGGTSQAPFSFHIGTLTGPSLNLPMKAETGSDGRVLSFRGTFTDPDGAVFTLTKRYEILPDEYMIRFSLDVDGEYSGQEYSVGFGPQIGPAFDEYVSRYVYRHFCLFDGEKKNVRVPGDEPYVRWDEQYPWLGLEGRFFTLLVLPEFSGYNIAWDQRYAEGQPFRKSFFVTRGFDEAGEEEDLYHVYIGPKERSILAQYNRASDNGFGLADKKLEEMTVASALVSLFSRIIKGFLQFVYRLIPNYGLAVFLFALITELLLFPLSRRTYINSAKMQALGPEIGEIRGRLKWNKEEMNAQIYQLFAARNVKPRSSMAPFLIRLPLFMFLYTLLLSDVQMRMGTVIPGLIPDVTMPDSLRDLSPATIPLVGWSHIRLLPVIMLIIMLLQSRFTQAPAESMRSMQVMSYLFPFMIFLVIYNMPSGVVIYWITMSALSILHQYYVKRHLHRWWDAAPPR